MKRELKLVLNKEEVKEAVKQWVERLYGDKVVDVVVDQTKLGEQFFEVQCQTKSPKQPRKPRVKKEESTDTDPKRLLAKVVAFNG